MKLIKVVGWKFASSVKRTVLPAFLHSLCTVPGVFCPLQTTNQNTEFGVCGTGHLHHDLAWQIVTWNPCISALTALLSAAQHYLGPALPFLLG